MTTKELFPNSNKIDDQEDVWEIPQSNSFVSDSDSPLSLLSSPAPTMPSPTLVSASIVPISCTPYSNNYQEKLQLLSYASTATIHDSNNNKTTIQEDNDSESEEKFISSPSSLPAKNNNNMYQEHIIACNNTISCIRPQSISIKWLTSTATTSNTDEEASNSFSSANNSGQNEEEYQPYNTTNDDSLSQNMNSLSPNENNSAASAHGRSTIRIIFSNREKRVPNRQNIQDEDIDQDNNNCSLADNEDSTTSSHLEDDIVEESEGEELTNGFSAPTAFINNKRKRKYTKQYSKTSSIDNKSKKTKVMPIENISTKSHKEVVNNDASSSIDYNESKQKRTVTSYDAQTSEYLKSVFFEVYSKQAKLTKEQRAKVQERTGLPSRNITYWFSNHKRRFQNTLKVYRKAVLESEGAIKNYKDFLKWRRNHSLPDQVTEEEVLKCEEQEVKL